MRDAIVNSVGLCILYPEVRTQPKDVFETCPASFERSTGRGQRAKNNLCDMFLVSTAVFSGMPYSFLAGVSERIRRLAMKNILQFEKLIAMSAHPTL